jgi:SAM-dependent methyltransferase
MNAAVRARFVERAACVGCRGTALREVASGRFDEGVVGRFIAEDPWGEHPAPFLAGMPWRLVECERCGLTFHRHVLDAAWGDRRFDRWMTQEAIQTFEANLPRRDDRVAIGSAHVAHALRIERLTRTLRDGAAARLLDFGCGYGDFLAVCAALGFTAVGVDRAAAKRTHGSYARVHESLDQAAPVGPFHAITLFEVLEHLDQPLDMLERLRELLVRGGVLVLETPDCTGVRDIRTRDDYAKLHPLDHINGFTPATLTRIARRAGFEPVARPLVVVSARPLDAAKAIARHMLSPLRRATTQLYFRKA